MQIVETGLVIGGHYLLQRLIKQGQYSTVYQGVDQLFQRMVAVKAVPAAHIQTYRVAVRLTSQFSHPNIVGLYDLAIKPDRLYLVQEYIEGEDFASLLQAPLQPYEVADIGCQICSAVIYASSSARRICHGDLTPAAILRDHRGNIRVNNFALPGDQSYFSAWSTLGGEGIALSDQDLSPGVISPGRQADDTRAVGLLLYQLLTGRPPGTTVVEPPADGRLRFPRNIPPELCELVARTIIRRHPQHITTPEDLYEELKVLVETLEPILISSSVQPQTDLLGLRPVPIPGTGTGMTVRESAQPALGLNAYRPESSNKPAAMEMEATSHSAPTVAEIAIKPITTRQPTYPRIPVQVTLQPQPQPAQSSYARRLLWIGIILFILFFIIGFLGGHFFFHIP